MTAQYETALHRWFEEVWNQGREDVMAEMFPPEGIAHGLGDAPVHGHAEYLPFFRVFKDSFDGLRIRVEDYVADGERIAARCSVKALHAGKGLGITPTNQPLDFEFMAFATIRDGKIMEARNIIDFDKMYKQMGVFAIRQRENEALLYRWFDEVWNNKNENAIDEMLSADGVHHGIGPEPVRGVEGFKGFFRAFSSTFPDLQVNVHEAYSVDDRLCARYSATGTHRGEGLGIAPTNREVTFSGMGSCVVKDGKFIEVWNQVDFFSIYQQIGAFAPGSE